MGVEAVWKDGTRWLGRRFLVSRGVLHTPTYTSINTTNLQHFLLLARCAQPKLVWYSQGVKHGYAGYRRQKSKINTLARCTCSLRPGRHIQRKDVPRDKDLVGIWALGRQTEIDA